MAAAGGAIAVATNFSKSFADTEKPTVEAEPALPRPRAHPYFPETVRLSPAVGTAKDEEQYLVAHGRRIVLSVFTAYEIGLYVDAPGRRALAKAQGLGDKGMMDTLFDGKYSKVLRLVTYRDVPSQHLIGGWEKSLFPLLKQKATAAHMSEDEAEKQFLQFVRFLPRSVGKGVPLYMVWRPSGALELRVGDALVDTIYSPLLCECLFSVYLGEASVTPELRSHLLRPNEK
jgi:hypothetical protein